MPPSLKCREVTTMPFWRRVFWGQFGRIDVDLQVGLNRIELIVLSDPGAKISIA